MSIEKLEIVLETGEVFKTTTEVVPNPALILERLVKHAAIAVPISRKVSYVVNQKDNLGIGLVRMDEIPFNTMWWLSQDGSTLTPFKSLPGGDSTVLPTTIMWKFDTSVMVPIFVGIISLGNDLEILEPGSCYLFFVDKVTGEFYTPPLPNVYEDGRLCTGALVLDQSARSLGFLDFLTDVVQAWGSNTWNTDLFGSPEKQEIVKRVFQLDPTTLRQVPLLESDKLWFREYGVSGFVPGTRPAVQQLVIQEARRLAEVQRA